MSYIPVVERAVMPLAVILNVTPVVSLAPGFAVAFGFTMTPRYLVTGIIVFFPLLVNSLVGLRAIDHEALQYFQSLHASRLEVLRHLRIPSSLPFLFAAARSAFPYRSSVRSCRSSRRRVRPTVSGLSSRKASRRTTYRRFYAAIFCLSLLGLAFTLLVTLVERRVLRWQAARSSAGADMGRHGPTWADMGRGPAWADRPTGSAGRFVWPGRVMRSRKACSAALGAPCSRRPGRRPGDGPSSSLLVAAAGRPERPQARRARGGVRRQQGSRDSPFRLAVRLRRLGRDHRRLCRREARVLRRPVPPR